MICIIMILLNGWCRMRMRSARLVSYVFLYTTHIGHPFLRLTLRSNPYGKFERSTQPYKTLSVDRWHAKRKKIGTT